MKQLLSLLLCLAACCAPAAAQNDHCDHFPRIMEAAKKLWDAKKFEEAFAKLSAAREACPGRAPEVDAQYAAFIRDIANKYQTADQKTREAREQAQRAEAATRLAQANAARSDSTALAAQRAARRAYANDLAYKSQIALQRGDRSSAYRLAEFAHRYVDDDNLQVTRALVAALYYNDDPSHSPLPWASNLEGHTSSVSSVAFSPDGKRLATGSHDNTAKIWDLESGKTVLTLEGRNSSVLSVAFSPDGKRLATGSYDNTAQIWDLESGKTVLTLEGRNSSVLSVAFSPDGKRLATSSNDNTAQIWDLESGKTALTLEGHTSRVLSVAFSPDGKRLATGSEDHTAKIWDLQIPSLSGQVSKTALTLEGHTGSVRSVAFSPDGKRLATGSEDHTAKIWDLETGKTALSLEGHNSWVWSVAFSPDGRRLATGSEDKTAKIWDLQIPSLSGQVSKTALTLEGRNSRVLSVAFSPDGERLATGSDDNTAKIWDLESGKTALTLEGQTDGVSSVAFSPDGKRLATGSDNNTAKIWDLEPSTGQAGITTLTLEGRNSWVSSVAFSPDGKRLATGSEDKTAKIWDLETGKTALTLAGHNARVSSVAFSPDGKRLATGSEDKTAKIWDLETGKTALTLAGHNASVLSVAFSPDGKRLATGSFDNTAKIWDLETGKTALTLEGHGSSFLSVAFSPDGKRLATGSNDHTAKIWDLDPSTGQAGKTALTLAGHNASVLSVAFSPDGKRLATGSNDHTAKIWDLEPSTGQAGKTSLTLEGHTSWVNSVAFSPDGKRLATGSNDHTAKIWDLTPRNGLGSGLSLSLGVGRENRLAGLTSPQLSEYGLENLLDQIPGNEDSLVAGKNVWQIAAFAELSEQQTRNSKQLRRTALLYARADRLYRAAAYLSDDSIFVFRLGALYKNWAEDILESGRPDTAGRYVELACRLAADKSACPDLWQRYSEQTGQVFDFGRFLASENPGELNRYGDYFFRKKKWDEARQLYEKAEKKEHKAAVLKKLFAISEKTGQAFDFDRFLTSENPGELKDYGNYFFYEKKWDEARQLYEKAENEEHDAEALQKLFYISEQTGQAFDFGRFLASENPGELKDYGDYFFGKEKWDEALQLYEKAEKKEHDAAVLRKLFSISEKTGQAFDWERLFRVADAAELGRFAQNLTAAARELENYKNRVAGYQNALRLRERQLTLDTTAALRVAVAREYNSLGFYQLFVGDGKGAEASIRRAIELDSTNVFTHSILAPALLLQGKQKAAEAEYKKWKDQPFNDEDLPTYRDAFLDDLKTLEEAGVPGIDFAQVRRWLE